MIAYVHRKEHRFKDDVLRDLNKLIKYLEDKDERVNNDCKLEPPFWFFNKDESRFLSFVFTYSEFITDTSNKEHEVKTRIIRSFPIPKHFSNSLMRFSIPESRLLIIRVNMLKHCYRGIYIK